MATFPFQEDIEPLLSSMDAIPIDPLVPYAEEFKRLLEERGDSLWGPQATSRSKLATRLHFAGWSRSELLEVGLKPKDVENFRLKYSLKKQRPGRQRGTKGSPPVSIFAAPDAETLLEGLKARQQELHEHIEACQIELQRVNAAIEAMKT